MQLQEAGFFAAGSGVAVDESTHDLYVADTGNHRVDEFSSTGAFLRAFGADVGGPGVDVCTGVCAPGTPGQAPGQLEAPTLIAVDNSGGPSAGDVYVADTADGIVTKFAADGTLVAGWGAGGQLTGFGKLAGVAVSAGGDLYVSHGLEENRLSRYTEAGSPVESFALRFEAAPVGIAVDPVGDIYKVRGSGAVAKLGTTGEEVAGELDPGPARSIALDPTSGHLYVSLQGSVHELDASGARVATFGTGTFGAGSGVAVDGSDGTVYVADAASSEIDVFGVEEGEAPTVQIGPPGALAYTTAEARGSVDPGGFATTCRFEYVTDERFRAEGFAAASAAPCGTQPGDGTGAVPVGAQLTGLRPGTEYHLRLRAENAAGTSLSEEPNPVFSTVAVAAPTVTISPPGGIGGRSARLEGTIDPGGTDPAFDVEWHFECTPGCPGLPGGRIAADTGVHPVSVQATGLSPHTTYEVTLVGENAGARAVAGPETFATQALAPEALTGTAASVSDEGATLVGSVDPANAPLGDCRFEWGLDPAYGHDLPCATLPGPVDRPVEVTASIEGLEPGTTYHYRLAASGAFGDAAGGDSTFTTRTRAESSLPARGYELVSAADTNGISPLPDQGSADGDALDYSTFTPTPGARSGGYATFLATRSADGAWTQSYIGAGAPPPGRPVTGETVGSGTFLFSADFGTAALSLSQGLDPEDRNGAEDVYEEHPADGRFGWLSGDPEIAGPQTDGAGAGPPLYLSPDGRQVLFESRRRLLASDPAPAGAKTLYQSLDGALTLVGRVPAGASSSCDDGGEVACVGAPAGSELGSGAFDDEGTTYGAASRDGRRVFFEAPDGEGRRQIYARIEGSRTIELSAGQPPVPSARAVRFAGASASGRFVFFTSSSPLTPDSGAGGEESGPADIYEYDLDSGTLRDLTPAAGGAAVRRVYDVSADGRRVYFTSSAQLGGAGAAGGPNLYLLELDAEGEPIGPPDLVATIDPGEDEPGGARFSGLQRLQALREVSADEDGSVIAFRDRLAAVPGRATGGFSQVYVYDAHRHELACASCPGDGGAPTAPANLVPSLPVPGSPEATPIGQSGEKNPLAPHPRNVAADGEVFFQTATSLLPGDQNGQIDVYEWHGGRLALVSSGTGAQPAMFGEASADGGTVFFRSGASLVAGAQAGIQHLYAARVGGGYAPPGVPPPCLGEDCKVPQGVPATVPGAGTSLYSGPGNPKPRHARHTGRRRRHGRVHGRAAARHRAGRGPHRHDHRGKEGPR